MITKNRQIYTGTNTRSSVRTHAHSHTNDEDEKFWRCISVDAIAIPWALKIKWKVVRTATFQRVCVFNCSLSLLFESVREYSIHNVISFISFRFVLLLLRVFVDSVRNRFEAESIWLLFIGLVIFALDR